MLSTSFIPITNRRKSFFLSSCFYVGKLVQFFLLRSAIFSADFTLFLGRDFGPERVEFRERIAAIPMP